MKTLGTWALAALASISASAVQTKTWSQNSQEDFDKATTKGVSLRNDGQITLAPAVKSCTIPPCRTSGRPFTTRKEISTWPEADPEEAR